MAPKKKKKKGKGRHSKTPGQTSASNPNPTATSPSASSPTGDATTTSLVPSSAFVPSAPTTTTSTQLIPSAPPQPTSILPSSASQITTNQPLPTPQPLPVQETHQERISCTSDGTTTTDLAGPSSATSASAASMTTPRLLPITEDFMSLYAPAVAGAVAALHCLKEEEPAELHERIVYLLGSQLDVMQSAIESLLGLAERMKGDAEVKAALEALCNMDVLRISVEVAGMMLEERKKQRGNGGSCGGSKGGDGGPDSGSGEGDGEGGGVSV